MLADEHRDEAREGVERPAAKRIAGADVKHDQLVVSLDAGLCETLGDAIDERLAQSGVQRDDELIVLHVSAGNPFRRWPLDAFSRLIAMLVRKHAHRRIVVVSGPSEKEAAAQVVEQSQAQLDASARDRVLSGEFT